MCILLMAAHSAAHILSSDKFPSFLGKLISESLGVIELSEYNFSDLPFSELVSEYLQGDMHFHIRVSLCFSHPGLSGGTVLSSADYW